MRATQFKPNRQVSWLAVTLLITACGGGGSSSAPSDSEPSGATVALPDLAVTRVFSALSFEAPVGLLQAPGDPGHWYLVEQAGRVLRFENRESVLAGDTSLVLDLSSAAADPAHRRVDAGGEKGLLGLAFHPRFPDDPRVFASYTGFGAQGQSQSVLASVRSNDAGLTLDPDSIAVLLRVDQPFANHNGGHIAFGPDGLLYLGLGDGGSGGDPQGNAQRCSNLLGAILRLDPDAGPAGGYGIPADNPLVGSGLREELYAWGFRNPWRWSFDRANGHLWVGDVGQSRVEEVTRVARGENHGWRFREDSLEFSADSPGADCPAGPLVEPVAEYEHAAGDCSVTGGYVYRGASFPQLSGVYLYGDFCSGRIRGLRATDASPVPRVLADTGLQISAFAEDLDGEIHVVDRRGGLYRVAIR